MKYPYSNLENFTLPNLLKRSVQLYGENPALGKAGAEAFYAVHAERPFYGELVDFMISGPVVVTVLEGENAMTKNRDLMGATNPKEAEAGTIRADFAENIDANAVHGSDSVENASIGIAFFFSEREIS